MRTKRSSINHALLMFLFFLFSTGLFAQSNLKVQTAIPIDSIRLSDPFILADKNTQTYYMTGTGGKLWKSKDLKLWDGPFTVVETDPDSWMGKRPMIWAAEIHQFKDKYY